MKDFAKKYSPYSYIIGCMGIFILLAFIYANPIFSEKQLFQHDIIQYKGGAQELLEHRKNHGEETYWSNSMFGGMPTYQMGAQFRGDIIKYVDSALMFLPKPVNYLVLLFSGFFLLGMVSVRNWKYALLSALMFGLSTYFYIIIAAGHNGKVHTIAYFAPLLAGIILIFIRKKYLWGFVVTTLSMALQLSANHPQMSYYLFLALGIFFLSELIRIFIKKLPFKPFLISIFVAGSAMVLAIGMNTQRLMANAEYVKETVRGKQLLNTENQNSKANGMDKESMLMWSYGQLETLNLFIPRLMGGGSSEKEGQEMMYDIQTLVQENAKSQSEVNNIVKALQSPTYWGEQPGTSGPAYQGAVVIFLAILALFFVQKRYKYWLIFATILSIFLAWGSNFMFFSDIFIEYMPFYNKFRAPSSILVIAELLLPLLGVLGLYSLLKERNHTQEFKQKAILGVTGGIIGFVLILILLGKDGLGFLTEAEITYLPSYLKDYLQEKRFEFFRTDAWKAIIYTLICSTVLFLSIKKKISTNITLIIIGVVSIFDLWSVNKRYLNEENFIDTEFAQNPFQTEISEYLVDKVGDNRELQGLLVNAKVNHILSEISEKDKSHYRIYNQTINPFGETNTSYFKSSIGGYHAVKLRRYDDLINTYFLNPDTIKTPKILNMLNTKYMIFGDTENPQVIPNPYTNGNAWLVSDIKIAKNPNEEIALIGEIDTKKIAIIGKEDQEYLHGKSLQPDSLATISLTKYSANSLEYTAKTKTPQLAVFSEIYYPHGWKILIDQQEVPYIKANYLLRAVYIPKGKHTISMKFEPKVITKGKYISWLSTILFVLSVIFVGFWKRKKIKP